MLSPAKTGGIIQGDVLGDALGDPGGILQGVLGQEASQGRPEVFPPPLTPGRVINLFSFRKYDYL